MIPGTAVSVSLATREAVRDDRGASRESIAVAAKHDRSISRTLPRSCIIPERQQKCWDAQDSGISCIYCCDGVLGRVLDALNPSPPAIPRQDPHPRSARRCPSASCRMSIPTPCSRTSKTLSSDEFEGRGPGTKGEELTVAYLIDQFKKIGLKPGNTDGTYIQKVPLVGITPEPAPLSSRKAATAKHAQVERRCGGVDQACRRFGERRRIRSGVRRLRRRRARIRLGRLQGRRREGQDAPHARQRSAGRRSGERRPSSTPRCSAARR